ncbi:MAG: phosphoglycerate dehydrogenase [Spirochaetia bacterium]|jgi:phosphoglycerate dehydrogenase-like enzyme
MARILITPRSLTRDGDPALELLRKAGHDLVLSSPGKAPDEEELLRLVPGCVGWIAGVEKITEKVLREARSLKVISRNGTGVDSIDLEACKRMGISVLRAEGANSRGVAELTIGLLLSLVRSIPSSSTLMKAGGWERRQGVELEGRTLGVVGCGKIGKLVARFALSLDMQVLGFDVYPDFSFTPSPRFRFTSRDDLLASSEFITLHSPYTAGEPPVINRASIASMKRGVYLINTARAGLVDDAAVLEALGQGLIAGYAVDAYDREPPAPSPLLSHEKVITTPHIGAFTAESVSRATRFAVESLLAALEKE